MKLSFPDTLEAPLAFKGLQFTILINGNWAHTHQLTILPTREFRITFLRAMFIKFF